ncbi:MAG TPA: iron ABC transporter permease [Candidatus Ventrimonas merdavium]|nr:iron ABC transporter permease [Candidatus Ventrimonas merdavium]
MQKEAATGAMGGQRTFSRKRRLKNQIENVLKNPYNIMVVISVIMMVYLIVIPLFQMIVQTLTLAEADVARVEGGREGMATLYYWKRVMTSSIANKMLWTPLGNSLVIAVSVAVLGITLGSVLAWLMVRSDLPHKKFFSLALIIPYMIPSWCKSMAWLTIFKNERVGGAAGVLGYLGIQTPDWLAYGPVAIIAVLVIHYYAYAYLLVSAALGSINSELEEMGSILGAGKARILRKITFPLVLPAILSAVIMTFSKAMGTFGVPSMLGLKIGYYTVSTTMYNSIQNGQNRVAFAISLILIGIASLSVFLNQKAIGTRKSYSTIGGKGGRTNPIPLGKWRPVITGLLYAFIAVAVVIPVVIPLYQSFMLEAGNYGLDNLTLHYWIGGSVPTIDQGEPGIFKNPQFLKYVGNTLKLVILTSLFATVLGQLIGYINSRGRKLFSGKLVEQLVFIPYLIPSIAFGAMYLALFATAKKVEMFGYRITLVPSLYGTFALLVLIAVVKNLPFASRAGTSNMLQISTELEEAAQIANAGFFKRFFRIIFPLSKGGMMSGFMLVFISIMKELDLIVILMTPSQQTLPYMAYSYTAENLIQLSSAVTIVMFILVFFVYWFANTFTDADITKGF